MPNRQTRRAVAKKVKPEDQTIMEITTGGVEYHLSFIDVSAWDEERLERASRPHKPDGSPTGERGVVLSAELGGGDFTLRAIAGLIYLRRSEVDDKVTYEQCARELKLSDLESVKMLSPEELEEKKGVDPTDPSH